jgi:bifunctional DNA-binding transcriptional regulator/antitoxin component of YhaV-PrlF toxin-antitoxin module
MSKVSSKRQITLPIELCLLAGIEPGDNVSILADRQGIISIVKKTVGASKGILKNVQKINNVSDEKSVESVMNPAH